VRARLLLHAHRLVDDPEIELCDRVIRLAAHRLLELGCARSPGPACCGTRRRGRRARRSGPAPCATRACSREPPPRNCPCRRTGSRARCSARSGSSPRAAGRPATRPTRAVALLAPGTASGLGARAIWMRSPAPPTSRGQADRGPQPRRHARSARARRVIAPRGHVRRNAFRALRPLEPHGPRRRRRGIGNDHRVVALDAAGGFRRIRGAAIGTAARHRQVRSLWRPRGPNERGGRSSPRPAGYSMRRAAYASILAPCDFAQFSLLAFTNLTSLEAGVLERLRDRLLVAGALVGADVRHVLVSSRR
jgi:hypothetical protein